MAFANEFNCELVLGPPSPEVIQAARDCFQILYALPYPDLENVFTAGALLMSYVLGNMNFEKQEDRDRIPDLFAETLKRNLRFIDEHDRSIGSRA